MTSRCRQRHQWHACACVQVGMSLDCMPQQLGTFQTHAYRSAAMITHQEVCHMKYMKAHVRRYCNPLASTLFHNMHVRWCSSTNMQPPTEKHTGTYAERCPAYSTYSLFCILHSPAIIMTWITERLCGVQSSLLLPLPANQVGPAQLQPKLR